MVSGVVTKRRPASRRPRQRPGISRETRVLVEAMTTSQVSAVTTTQWRRFAKRPRSGEMTLAQATMVTGPAGASVDVLARKAFLNPACQNEVGLVAVVPGVLRLEPRRPLPDGRLSDHLAVSELIPRQINFHASRKPIPHVRFRSLAVAEDVRRQDFSAKDVVQDQRRNVALPARGIARRPSIVLFRRIETPAGSDGAFDLSERVHRTRVPTSGDIPERWPRRQGSP